jgi:hypothetical protein
LVGPSHFFVPPFGGPYLVVAVEVDTTGVAARSNPALVYLERDSHRQVPKMRQKVAPRHRGLPRMIAGAGAFRALVHGNRRGPRSRSGCGRAGRGHRGGDRQTGGHAGRIRRSCPRSADQRGRAHTGARHRLHFAALGVSSRNRSRLRPGWWRARWTPRVPQQGRTPPSSTSAATDANKCRGTSQTLAPPVSPA